MSGLIPIPDILLAASLLCVGSLFGQKRSTLISEVYQLRRNDSLEGELLRRGNYGLPNGMKRAEKLIA